MKTAVAFVLGFIIATFLVQGIVKQPHFQAASKEPRFDSTGFAILDSAQLVRSRVVHERLSGKFPVEIVEMIHVIFPPDSFEAYVEPDSGNTEIFFLDNFSTPYSNEKVILIESRTGCESWIGWDRMVTAGRYFVDEKRWECLMTDYGWVDSVYKLRHNGLLDFAVGSHWEDKTHRYQFDTEKYVAERSVYQSDSDQVADIMEGVLGSQGRGYYRYCVLPTSEWEYVTLDSSSSRYLFVGCQFNRLFILREEKTNEFTLVNFLEGTMESDILRQRHNGMSDIKTFNTDYTYGYYRWNGSTYVLHHKEEWHCDA